MAKYKSGDYSFETSGYIINAMGKFNSWLCENPKRSYIHTISPIPHSYLLTHWKITVRLQSDPSLFTDESSGMAAFTELRNVAVLLLIYCWKFSIICDWYKWVILFLGSSFIWAMFNQINWNWLNPHEFLKIKTLKIEESSFFIQKFYICFKCIFLLKSVQFKFVRCI